MNETEKILANYFEVLNSQKFIEADLDYSILDKHIEFLEKLNVIENSSISIFDLHQKKHLYLSSRFETIFGFNIQDAHREGNKYFDMKVHPQDNLDAMKIGAYFMKIILKIPVEERKDYKLINDYRIKDRNNQYVRVIEQFQTLELDKHGNIWLALCVMDVSPNQDLNLPLQNKVINFKTGESFHFPKDKKEIELSKREREILGLISEGMISKEIADSLFISVHTVNTHRQKIIEKLGAKNSYEAIRNVKKYNLI